MKYGLLARVSGEEQVEGYSLDAQVRAFNTLVETREGSVYHQWIEEGVSARTDDISKRPLFRRAIDEALAGRYDVLVVHKLDRFARNARITLEYLEKLEKAGVGFVSITEQMDFSTPIVIQAKAAINALNGNIFHQPTRTLIVNEADSQLDRIVRKAVRRTRPLSRLIPIMHARAHHR